MANNQQKTKQEEVKLYPKTNRKLIRSGEMNDDGEWASDKDKYAARTFDYVGVNDPDIYVNDGDTTTINNYKNKFIDGQYIPAKPEYKTDTVTMRVPSVPTFDPITGQVSGTMKDSTFVGITPLKTQARFVVGTDTFDVGDPQRWYLEEDLKGKKLNPFYSSEYIKVPDFSEEDYGAAIPLGPSYYGDTIAASSPSPAAPVAAAPQAASASNGIVDNKVLPNGQVAPTLDANKAGITSFGNAFKAARNACLPFFTFNGKWYNTKLAGESDDAWQEHISTSPLNSKSFRLKGYDPVTWQPIWEMIPTQEDVEAAKYMSYLQAASSSNEEDNAEEVITSPTQSSTKEQKAKVVDRSRNSRTQKKSERDQKRSQRRSERQDRKKAKAADRLDQKRAELVRKQDKLEKKYGEMNIM